MSFCAGFLGNEVDWRSESSTMKRIGIYTSFPLCFYIIHSGFKPGMDALALAFIAGDLGSCKIGTGIEVQECLT